MQESDHRLDNRCARDIAQDRGQSGDTGCHDILRYLDVQRSDRVVLMARLIDITGSHATAGGLDLRRYFRMILPAAGGK
jgi:hypothetical protein